MSHKNISVDELTAIAKAISERRRAEVGITMLVLNPEKVPPSVRPLLKHAAILGIGDDGTRNEIFEAVPTEYLDVVREAIRESSELYDWYRKAETTDAKHLPEVAAIGWMLFGLNLG